MTEEKQPKNISAELTFEQALEELENLVSRMENGGLPLDELVRGFEHGKKLASLCRKQLDTLERKITILSPVGKWDDFDPESGKRIDKPATESDDLPF